MKKTRKQQEELEDSFENLESEILMSISGFYGDKKG